MKSGNKQVQATEQFTVHPDITSEHVYTLMGGQMKGVISFRFWMSNFTRRGPKVDRIRSYRDAMVVKSRSFETRVVFKSWFQLSITIHYYYKEDLEIPKNEFWACIFRHTSVGHSCRTQCCHIAVWLWKNHWAMETRVQQGTKVKMLHEPLGCVIWRHNGHQGQQNVCSRYFFLEQRALTIFFKTSFILAQNDLDNRKDRIKP